MSVLEEAFLSPGGHITDTRRSTSSFFGRAGWSLQPAPVRKMGNGRIVIVRERRKGK